MHTTRIKLALFAVLALTTAPISAPQAQVVIGVSIRVAPPVLPVYVQPPIPGPRYIWVPGYWAWGSDDYYWVPGTWVLAPGVGLLWTPGYWGWRDGLYAWNAGYWGPRVGFYGGVSYGFGYTGVGFQGGYWNGGVFMYNRGVTNFGSVQITNVYNKTVINNTTVTNVSFNGGPGGLASRPTTEEQAAALDKHLPPTQIQSQHQQAASTNRALFAKVNKGNPAVAATARAGQFTGAGVVGAKGAQALPHALNKVNSSGGLHGANQLSSTKAISGSSVPKTPPSAPKGPKQFNQAKVLPQGGNQPKKPPPPHGKKPEQNGR
jgi:hypothetical protein